MISHLMNIDGVKAVAYFKEGPVPELMESYGDLPGVELEQLCRFANDYKRMVQGMVDQLALFTDSMQWTPADGWALHGPEYSACGWGGLVCLYETRKAPLNTIIGRVKEEFFYK
ncbi:MAG: DUF2173 family protein [Pseudomonadota bacterium]